MGTANPQPKQKKESFKQKLLKAIRMSMWKRKAFVGTYWDNDVELRKFILERNIIIIHIERGKDKLHEFDFRLQGTQAQKKDRKVVLYYVEDNWFMRQLGFRNNMSERVRYQ